MEVTHHMSMNIAGFMRNYKSYKGHFNDENGKLLSHVQAKKYLEECLEKGWRVIPMGNCPNFDYQEGCPGHEDLRKDRLNKFKEENIL